MNRRPLLPYLCGAGAILCWASLAAAIGQSLRGVAPETVLLWGLLVAGLLLSAWELLRGRRAALRWPGWRVAAFGVYGIWGYHTLLVLAFASAPQLEANVLNYTWTLWIVLLGSLLPGHRFTLRIALAGAVGFAGVVLVLGGARVWGGAAPALAGHGVGFALALGASLTWSTFTVFLRRVVPDGSGHMALFCLLGAAAALVFAWVRGAPLLLPWASVPVVLYLGAVPLGLSFVLWERAAQGAQMQVLGLMSFFTPLLSTVLLSAVSGVPLGLPLLGGLALILGGAALGGTGLRPVGGAAGGPPRAPGRA
jgi:drug/metabolite transporter (DMT)-like permease